MLALLYIVACNSTPEPTNTETVSVKELTSKVEVRPDIKPTTLTVQNINEFVPNYPKKSNQSIYITSLNYQQQEVVEFLRKILTQYALTGDDPWAMAHALLALGPDAQTPDGTNALDAIFTYADVKKIGGTPYPDFPTQVDRQGKTVLVEPHTDLMLKVFTEMNLDPQRKIWVSNSEYTLEDYYKGSILSSYLNPYTNDSSYASPNDMPWSVQGIAGLVRSNQEWEAINGQVMNSNSLSQFLVAVLAQETVPLKKAMQAGASFQKDKTGIFKYTCGGAHLLQSVAYITARGLGNAETNAEMQTQIALHFYRFPKELQIYDEYMKQQPQHKVLLLAQRLKFVGHFLETAQKMTMLGLYTPNQQQIGMMQGALDQLVLTIVALQREGVYQSLYNIKVTDPQLYKDIIGDSAHGLYAIYLFTGDRRVYY